MTSKIKIGIVGTSWWADAMYLPPLANYDRCEVVAACGRNRERAEAFAKRWEIPHVFTDYNDLIASGLCDALIIATANDTHHPIVMAALQANLHLLCEKPLALTYAQAREMADLAAEKGVTTAVPFTYRFMPTTRYIKSLIDDGYLGKPYHLHMRYFAGFGRDGAYAWRFNVEKAGSGALGDIGSHFLYLAYWFYGDVSAVCANLATMVERPALDPDGNAYEQADDTAMLMLRFANGAHGMVHATTLAHEPSSFGQLHQFDLHGSEGTLRQAIDWDDLQSVQGARSKEGDVRVREIPIPDEFWGAARRDEGVVATYKDVFRVDGWMVRGFVDAIADGRPASPDFEDGARIQAIMEAALLSAKENRWIELSELQ